MLRRLFLLAIAGTALTARAELSLAPRPTEYVSEGIKYTSLSFTDDKRTVTYVPPLLWTYSGSAARLQLTPTKIDRAEAVIEQSPLPAEQPLDDGAIELLKQQFMSSLPPASQGATLVSEERSPLLLSGRAPTYEACASYQALGETFLRSTLFANVGTTQLRFTLTARKADFEPLHRAFRASVISWQWSAPPAAEATAANGAPASPAPASTP